MIGRQRLENVHACLDAIRADGIPGDLIECGVWAGRRGRVHAGYLAAHELAERRVFVADSFAGLPKPAAVDEGLDISSDVVPIPRDRAGPVEESVPGLRPARRPGPVPGRLVRGHACPGGFLAAGAAPAGRGSVSSTRDALVACYDRVVPGGFVIVDDYGAIPQCARAVTDFRAERGITDPIHTVDWTGVYWRKT